jgi:hypothetical protein
MNIARDVPLEAPNDLSFRHALRGASCHVLLGRLMTTESRPSDSPIHIFRSRSPSTSSSRTTWRGTPPGSLAGYLSTSIAAINASADRDEPRPGAPRTISSGT